MLPTNQVPSGGPYKLRVFHLAQGSRRCLSWKGEGLDCLRQSRPSLIPALSEGTQGPDNKLRLSQLSAQHAC